MIKEVQFLLCLELYLVNQAQNRSWMEAKAESHFEYFILRMNKI